MKVGARLAVAVCVPAKPGVDDDDEERRRRSRRASDLERARARAARGARAALLEARLGPQDGERDERDDEHDRRAPARTASAGSAGPGARRGRARARRPAGAATAALASAAATAVSPARRPVTRARTSSSAICTPAFSSSTSKRPSMVASKLNRAVPPAETSSHEVVAVHMDFVGDIGVDLEADAVALRERHRLHAALRLPVDDADRLAPRARRLRRRGLRRDGLGLGRAGLRRRASPSTSSAPGWPSSGPTSSSRSPRRPVAWKMTKAFRTTARAARTIIARCRPASPLRSSSGGPAGEGGCGVVMVPPRVRAPAAGHAVGRYAA